jgi:hypothetical protein
MIFDFKLPSLTSVFLGGQGAQVILHRRVLFGRGRGDGRRRIRPTILLLPEGAGLVHSLTGRSCHKLNNKNTNQPIRDAGPPGSRLDVCRGTHCREVLVFCDNTSALSAAVHGYSRNADMGAMSNMLHLELARPRCRPWFEWIPSKANPADIPSSTTSQYPLYKDLRLQAWPCGFTMPDVASLWTGSSQASATTHKTHARVRIVGGACVSPCPASQSLMRSGQWSLVLG